jgi:phosphohistidine phosphatase
MKQLYLLRHAKSSWKDTSLPDHDRPLAGRGRRAAKAIARHLREQCIEPELFLCSSARRARETLERIEAALATSAVRVEDDLYAASASVLLERLRTVPDTVGSAMLIGHNPGLQDLALDLARPSPTVRELATKYPTAALATLEFQGSGWQELGRDTAELVTLMRPRDLEWARSRFAATRELRREPAPVPG